MNKLFIVAFAALCLLSASRSVFAAPAMTVGDPKDPGALAQAIQAAYTGGARRIAIRPGTYLLPSVGHTAITLDGWKGATFSAYKVTLIITDLAWAHDVFDIVNCTGVTLAGPTLSQTSITSYQGRVHSGGHVENDGQHGSELAAARCRRRRTVRFDAASARRPVGLRWRSPARAKGPGQAEVL